MFGSYQHSVFISFKCVMVMEGVYTFWSIWQKKEISLITHNHNLYEIHHNLKYNNSVVYWHKAKARKIYAVEYNYITNKSHSLFSSTLSNNRKIIHITQLQFFFSCSIVFACLFCGEKLFLAKQCYVLFIVKKSAGYLV